MNALEQSQVDNNKAQFEKAFSFVKSLESMLCVYAETVDKLYLKYHARKTSSVISPEDQQSLVLLPESKKYPHVICDIPNRAVVTTDIRVIPGESIGKSGPYLSGIPKGKKTPSALPLLMGLSAMKNGYYEGGPMLPVVTYKALRAAPLCHTPDVRIHAVKLGELDHKPDAVKREIELFINNKSALV